MMIKNVLRSCTRTPPNAAGTSKNVFPVQVQVRVLVLVRYVLVLLYEIIIVILRTVRVRTIDHSIRIPTGTYRIIRSR